MKSTEDNEFDFIITGAGCAGLSLLYRMVQHSFFDDKKILIADKSFKDKNDRTWCFWEKGKSIFEKIIHHRWKQFDFYANDYAARFDFLPYEYKMIRSIDFYNYIINFAKKKENIHFRSGNIESVENEAGKAFATIDGEKFYAKYLFNSILFDTSFRGKYNLLQHFKGWLIETEETIFNENLATFMDFRAGQENGTTFFYVLPVSENKALIEYTLFSEKILLQNDYDNALKNYIENELTIPAYKIVEEEFGIIPMTDFKFSKGNESIVNIGTAGRQTKASSGFTFQFIQKRSAEIIDALVQNKDPHVHDFLKNRFYLYDHVLLNILTNKKMEGVEIFKKLFKKNPVELVLKFLDNETTFWEELKIMQTMPANLFLPAALKELFHF